MAPKPKKASTSYSPAPMSDAAKRKASRAGAEKARQYTDLPARRPSPNPARTSYSPQMMTAYDKAKAAARGKATAAKTTARGPKAGTTTVAAVARRFGVTAREARDIATAIGAIRDVVTNRSETGARGGTPRQLRNAVKNIATQYKETAKAAVTGKPGKPSKTYQSKYGDDAQTFYGRKNR